MTDAILGKRKERDETLENSQSSTFFVSNLPYSVTSTDLQTLFSDLAPVRSAFVVLSNNVSKGVGYVSFAIKEDAKMAMESIEKDGLQLNGRALRVQWADRKHHHAEGEGDGKDEKKSQKVHAINKTPMQKMPKDPNAVRTVLISGLPSSVDHKTLWKKLRKLKGAESAELKEDEAGSAQALFATPSDASHAVEKLHAHVFKGSILSVTLKKRVEALAKPSVKVSDSNATPNRGSRLIVRNVPWNITEQDLRALFLPFGPIYSITMPKVPLKEEESIKNQRSRGFVFIWYYSKKDAERAIEGVNGREVVAGAITAPTMNKKERARLRKKARQNEANGDDAKEDSGDEDDDEESEQKTKGRVLAVDWALSKEKWEKAKEEHMDVDDAESAVDNDKEDGSDASTVESDSNSEDDSDDYSASSDVNIRSDTEEAVKPTLPQTDVGTTVFVRNVPFEATEDELRSLFRSFGPLRYARITVDPQTSRSRGTGFVCFWNKNDADKAIEQADLLNKEAGSSGTGSKASAKNPFSLPSLLTPDPSSSLAHSLVLHGRTLSVTRAVTREDASRLKDEGERAREKADKRNLYLLREGVIFPNSPAAASLSPAELEKRNTSFGARRNMLKSNPSLFVSKTRLSIRQLPLFVSDRALKRLGMHATRSFEDEVKSGSRQGLSADDLYADKEHAETNPKPQRKKGERNTGVKQAKVVRQTDRIDPVIGKGRSRGYGFLEMTSHADALRVLRWANNNKALLPLFEEWWKGELEDTVKTLEDGVREKGEQKEDDTDSRIKRIRQELERLRSGEARKGSKTLIVEFSIENTQVVKRRNEKIESTKSVPNENRVEDDEGEPDKRSPKKKRKVEVAVVAKAAPLNAETADTQPTKPQNPLGSMIGRKRKMRKAKGKP